MKRTLAGGLLVLAVAVPVAACGGDDSSSGGGYGYAGGGGGGSTTTDCSGYTTCDTCTPVNGCGWCFDASGGQCSTDPDSCSITSEFTWTWDPTGCPGVDASVAPLDAGTKPGVSASDSGGQ